MSEGHKVTVTARDVIEWTMSGDSVPELLRHAAQILEENKRIFVHTISLSRDAQGGRLTVYGEWMGGKGQGGGGIG